MKQMLRLFLRTTQQEKYRQEQLSKLKAEEDAKVRFNDCTKHYENQIRTMRVNHEQVKTSQPLILVFLA